MSENSRNKIKITGKINVRKYWEKNENY